LIADQSGRRIGEPLGALECVQRGAVEVVDSAGDRESHVADLTRLVEAELDARAAVLVRVHLTGRVVPLRLVLHFLHPDPADGFLHAIQKACVPEAAAVEQRLVAFIDAAQVVRRRSAGDRAERLAWTVEREIQRTALSRRARSEARNPERPALRVLAAGRRERELPPAAGERL